jgi:hypothetical protein
MYFASLIIIKSLTAVPLELMRIVPLIEIYFVKLFIDKKKCTRRELRSGTVLIITTCSSSVSPCI